MAFARQMPNRNSHEILLLYNERKMATWAHKIFKQVRVQNCKEGCVFPMAVVPILHHVEVGRNEHRIDAPHFTPQNLQKSVYELTLKFFNFQSNALFWKVQGLWCNFFYFYITFSYQKNVKMEIFNCLWYSCIVLGLIIFVWWFSEWRKSRIYCDAKHFIILTYNERVYNEVGDESFNSGTSKNL